MEVVPVVGKASFYVLSLVISGGLFFWWRRLFRRFLRSEAAIVIATAMAAIITTPVVLLALLWVTGGLGTVAVRLPGYLDAPGGQHAVIMLTSTTRELACGGMRLSQITQCPRLGKRAH